MITNLISPTHSTVITNPNVIFRRLGEEIVLFHLESDKFYELNGTAARLWELLQTGKSENEIRDEMVSEFAVAPEQLASEMEALLKSLRQEELIVFHE